MSSDKKLKKLVLKKIKHHRSKYIDADELEDPFLRKYHGKQIKKYSKIMNLLN